MNSIDHKLVAFYNYLYCLWIPEIPKLREYVRKRLLDKKRRTVTKYVTEAFGLLLLTDSFSSTQNLPVWKTLGFHILPVPGQDISFYQVRKLSYDIFSFHVKGRYEVQRV